MSQDIKLIKTPLLRQISKSIFKTLKAFGLYSEGEYMPMTEGANLNIEEAITPLMNALA
jgi:hypothetical protein